jgi:hypothetical protein
MTIMAQRPLRARSAVREPREHLERAKIAQSVRRVDLTQLTTLVTGVAPRRGDVVLAVVDRVGQHKRLQLASGRLAALFPGDTVVAAYGDRYASDQFEAEVPPDLSPCHLVAGGGIASLERSRHAKMSAPTAIEPLGLLGYADGRPANLSDWALERPPDLHPRPLTIAVAGTSMNAGKTTTAASLVRGLSMSGLRVGAAKVTGTAASGDRWLMADAGADPVVDFTDAGFATTYRIAAHDVERIFATLTGHLAMRGVDVIVLELADGLFQSETEALVAAPRFASGVDAVVFAADGALGAAAGVDRLVRCGLNVVAVSGVVTTSPLAMRETELATRLPVLTTDSLADAAHAERLYADLSAQTRAA